MEDRELFGNFLKETKWAPHNNLGYEDPTNLFQNWKNMRNTNNATPTGNFLGGNFNYLADLLKGNISRGLDQNKYRNNAAGLIGKATNRQVKNSQENLNASGLSRSGVGYSVVNDIYGKESEALAGVENNLINQDIAFKQNSISQLLGLNQFEGGQNFGAFQSDRQNSQFNQSQNQQWQMFMQQLQSQPEAWEGILGSLLGAGTQVGTAALSDIRFKENIKKIGKRGDIDIVEFNYIGHPQRFSGVIAQQIEGTHPEAVQEINGFKYVDYSKIGISMKAI